MNFFDVEIKEKPTYNYKILVYPNITYNRDLEKDSFIVVIKNIIEEMNKKRMDIHWTFILPEIVPSISQFDNVDILIYKFPSYPNAMRTHFNFTKLMKLIDWQHTDFDFVYTHLPEHTLQLSNLFYNNTNLRPKFIGYCHWFEFPEITNYEKDLLPVNILGLLEMDECGVNTIAQKNLLLKNAEKWFNKDVINKLDKIVQPHYLGWEIPKYEKRPVEKNLIVFNHRAHTYKNFPQFIKMMDMLWETRKDFKVWIPLLEENDYREYIITNKFNRFEYFSKLSTCYLGVACKQKYAGWSVSATDGMSVGVPYLFFDDDYYHELAGDAGIYFKTESEFLQKINHILDNTSERDKYSKRSLERFADSTWDKRVSTWFNKWNIFNFPENNETESYKKMVNFIEKNKSVSKGQILDYLNWGIRIPFTSYRNMLRKNDNIKLTVDGYEWLK